jgi:hypothetical protein
MTAGQSEDDRTEDIGEVGSVRSAGLTEKRVWPAFEELVRAGLAALFALMLAATGAWAFIEVHSSDWGHVKNLLDILVPAESALLGSAVGFYFGTKK